MENAATIEYREIKEQIDKLLTKITAEIAAEQAKDEKREINWGDVGTAQRNRSQLIQHQTARLPPGDFLSLKKPLYLDNKWITHSLFFLPMVMYN